MVARSSRRTASNGRIVTGQLVLLALVLGSAPAAQDVVKLSGPPPFIPTGFTNETHISPDGEWVVYEASQDVEGWNLYSVPTKGRRSPVQLAGPLDTEYAFVEFGIDPNSVFVVYRALGHLYSVPIDDPAGTIVLDEGLEPFVVDARHARVTASVSLDAGSVPLGAESVESLDGGFAIDPTGTWVLFTDGATLYSVPIDGSQPPIELHAGLFESSYSSYAFTPNGSEVVYRAEEVDDIVAPALFVVPVDGSAAPRRISHAPIAQRGVASFALDADGETAVFHSDQVQDEKFELFSVPVDGSAEPVRISAPLAAFSNIGYYVWYTQIEYVIVGARVVYRCDHDLDEVFEFYSVPIEGGAPPVKLHDPLSGDSDVAMGLPVGTKRIVYYVRGQGVFVTRVDGSSNPIRLDSESVSFNDSVGISPDGRWFLYRHRVGPIGNSHMDLYRVALNGRSGPVRLAEFVGGGYGPAGTQFTTDSEHVVFLSDVIYRVRLDGSEQPVALTPGPVSHGHFWRFALTADGDRLVYTSEQERYDVPEIYSAPLDLSTEPVKLNGPITLGYVTGDVTHFDLAANGERAIFSTRFGYEDADGGLNQVFSVPLELGTERIPLFAPLSSAFGEDDLGEIPIINADGSYAAFAFGHEEGESYEIYACPSDGSIERVQLSGGWDWGAQGARFSPDGTRVAFTQAGNNSDGTHVRAVYSAPADASSPRVRLSPLGTASAHGAFTGSIRVSPDSSRVVFAANLALPGAEYELFSAPIDGSAEAVQLNDLEWPRGNLPERYDAQFSADGAWVVYTIDQDADEVVELYSVPADGSAPPRKLSGTVPANRDVSAGFQVVGLNVVFVADLETNDVSELFVVPIDGSAAPLKISGTMPASVCDVMTGFQLVPGGTHVVYRADQERNERFEIFVVPIDGSASPLKLNDELVAGGDVETPGYPILPFAVSADGARVVYLADQDQDDMSELFSVPIDRSSEPVQISGALAAGGTVKGNFRITSDSREVLYIADQDADEVFELFRARIGLGGTALRVSSPLVAGGDVGPLEPPWWNNVPDWGTPHFEITPAPTRVVYAADQELDGVRELYMAVLGPRPPGAIAPAGKVGIRSR